MRWCCLMPTRKPQSRPSLEQPLVLPASGEPPTGLTLPPGTATEGKCRLCYETLCDWTVMPCSWRLIVSAMSNL